MPRERWISLNFQAIAVGLLMAGVQAWALWAVADAPSSAAGQQQSSPGAGGGLLGVLVLETIVIVLAWRYRGVAPDWLRRAALRLILLALGVFAALIAVAFTLTVPAFGVSVASVLVLGYLFGVRRYGLDEWLLLHNVIAFVAATIVAVLLGSALGPAPMIVLLALALVWDHVAVNLSDVMGDLVEASAASKIPNYFALPSSIELQLADVRTFVRGVNQGSERPEELAMVIGVGDFVLPTALLVSITLEAGGAVHPLVALSALGIFASIPLLSAAEGPTPALPYLNSGAIAGVIVGVVLFPATLGVVT